MLFGKRLGASARPIDFADLHLGFADEDGNVYTIEDETDAAARFAILPEHVEAAYYSSDNTFYRPRGRRIEGVMYTVQDADSDDECEAAIPLNKDDIRCRCGTPAWDVKGKSRVKPETAVSGGCPEVVLLGEHKPLAIKGPEQDAIDAAASQVTAHDTCIRRRMRFARGEEENISLQNLEMHSLALVWEQKRFEYNQTSQARLWQNRKHKMLNSSSVAKMYLDTDTVCVEFINKSLVPRKIMFLGIINLELEVPTGNSYVCLCHKMLSRYIQMGQTQIILDAVGVTLVRGRRDWAHNQRIIIKNKLMPANRDFVGLYAKVTLERQHVGGSGDFEQAQLTTCGLNDAFERLGLVRNPETEPECRNHLEGGVIQSKPKN